MALRKENVLMNVFCLITLEILGKRQSKNCLRILQAFICKLKQIKTYELLLDVDERTNLEI